MVNSSRADTLRSKRNLKRRVRHVVRSLNKSVPVNSGISIRISDSYIRPWNDNSGWEAYFWITFTDKQNPARNYTHFYNPHEILYSGLFAGGHHLDSDFNEFYRGSEYWNHLMEIARKIYG
jgi:hypothetical protein